MGRVFLFSGSLADGGDLKLSAKKRNAVAVARDGG
jgi:hypothetical protein